MGKSRVQKEQDAWEADLQRFISNAATSEWKRRGSTFIDHESKTQKGLILRQETQSDKTPGVYRLYGPGPGELRTWVLECRGEYVLEIGPADYTVNALSADDACDMVKRLRAGEEQAIVRAYLRDTEHSIEANNSPEERDLLWRFGLADIDELIERDKALLETRSPRDERGRWVARRRVKVLKTMLKGLSAFATREGFKIRKPRPRMLTELARSRRAA